MGCVPLANKYPIAHRLNPQHDGPPQVTVGARA